MTDPDALQLATIDWTRGKWSQVKGKYAREHTWHLAGGTKLKATDSAAMLPEGFRDKIKLNPENLFVATVASAHMLSWLDVAFQMGIEVETYRFTIVWVWSTLLTVRQQARRHRNIAAAIEALTALRRRIGGPRSRIRGGPRIDLEVELILEKNHARRYLKVKRIPRPEHTFKQTHRGRPGPDTEYRRVTRRRYDLEWSIRRPSITTRSPTGCIRSFATTAT